MKRALLSGNEAVARGAYEGGCLVAAAYPGTPSTEILEEISKYKEIYCEWSVNEKVALEVALGAALAGARALCAMKHVGLNVAADPLFSSAYIGVQGGFIIVTCDDPGMHSSQNEQDNRFYGLFAKIPVLCPSDSQEAKDLVIKAFEISEEFDIPVILRMTTRVSHCKSVVNLGERREKEIKGYKKDVSKTNLLPQFAKRRHILLEEKLEKLKEYSNNFPYNRFEEGKSDLLVIADGVAYQYAKEVFKDASFLKLTMVYPFPDKLVSSICQKYKEIIVVEEVEPFIELMVKSLGFKVKGKGYLPKFDELNPDRLKVFIKKEEEKEKKSDELPRRPPVLCPGCPHIGTFYLLQKKDYIITGDIGCYTLGALAPHYAMDTCVCMGASITLAQGIEKVNKRINDQRPIISIIGDSTFFHMGVPGLLNMVYNKSDIILFILDNETTGMTGHQDHPGTGRTLMKEETKKILPEDIARACGIEKVYVLNPYKIRENKKIIDKLLKEKKQAVVIMREPCIFLKKREKPKEIDIELCTGCKLCIKLGCPAISYEDNKAKINENFCVGCGMCIEVCPKGAIK
ncbi:MAG: indolepyruvate ferredoxin oxidoreductase subunit alpha [candidate division WOR-3 bacterium]|nr:indolepyruvate ferredoxin oxidoreductase subunit alpha [candidate division WOR-3 bacterium]MDW8113853.1 indolepyruvate ferredoxin oxidoreductase subunit alpha [candidate division WOR-3 bacterium]